MPDRPQPVRIAYLTPLLQPGGAERQMLYLARSLPKPEFEIRFLLLSGRGRLASEAEDAGASVHVLGLDRERCRGSVLRCLPALLRALRRYRTLTRDVDIIDAWLVPSYTFAGLANPLVGGPILVAGRRSALNVARTRTRLREVAGGLAMHAVDAVVANSHAAAREAVDHEGIDPSKVHVIHNAVELPGFEVDDRQSVRRRWGFGDEHVVVGCVGNYKPGKGQDIVLEVAAALRDRDESIRYVLIGDGPLRPELEASLKNEGLESIVRLHSGEKDARRMYAALDICVQASDSEGLPNVVLEAAAARRAIVATDVGGTSEIITSGLDGMLVTRRSRGEIAVAITQLAADPDLRLRLGEAAGRKAQEFSVAKLAADTAALYRQLSPRA